MALHRVAAPVQTQTFFGLTMTADHSTHTALIQSQISKPEKTQCKNKFKMTEKEIHHAKNSENFIQKLYGKVCFRSVHPEYSGPCISGAEVVHFD